MASHGLGDKAAMAIEAAKASGNINIHDHTSVAVMDLSRESREDQQRHAEALRKVEAVRRARTMAVPTLPEDVRKALRQVGQPVRLFGENLGDVRDRLRQYLAQLELMGEEDALSLIGLKRHTEEAPKEVQPQVEEQIKDEVVYSVASDALIEARRLIAEYSFDKTSKRLTAAAKRRRIVNDPMDTDGEKPHGENGDHGTALVLCDRAKKLVINLSAVGDERPLSAVRCAPAGGVVATGSWSGVVRIWGLQGLSPIGQLQGHKERVTGIAWHPNAYKHAGPALLVSAAADKTLKIWNTAATTNNGAGQNGSTESCVSTLTGHADRLARVEFHPSGRFIGSASFDHTWRLWDVETGQQLLLQDGHHKEVYAIAFQDDGALVGTGDFSGIVRVWDLRSGKGIYTYPGHIRKVTCATFSPNGFELVTGSDDHTVRGWDLRKKECAFTLPAHTALISDVRYSGEGGELLGTTSFDGTARVWRARDNHLLSTLRGHEGRVSACDWTPDCTRIVTCSFDRTVKVWAHEDEF